MSDPDFERRRRALGCTHPEDEPCFGKGEQHDPPPQEPNKDAAPAAYDPPPGHYSTGAGIDPWAVWDAFGLDRDAYLANAVKYILRAGKKDIAPRLDDLIKARNYINKAIEREQK